MEVWSNYLETTWYTNELAQKLKLTTDGMINLSGIFISQENRNKIFTISHSCTFRSKTDTKQN